MGKKKKARAKRQSERYTWTGPRDIMRKAKSHKNEDVRLYNRKRRKKIQKEEADGELE